MASATSALALIRACRPKFRHDYDRAMFAAHAVMLASGYRLIACGHAAEQPGAEAAIDTDVGVENWDSLEDRYAFLYAPEKVDRMLSYSVSLKGMVMNDMLLLDVMLLPSPTEGGPYSSQIKVGDYCVTTSSANYADHFKNLGGLVDKIRGDIVANLEISKPVSLRDERSERPSTSQPQPGTMEHPEQLPIPVPQPYPGYGPMVPDFGSSDLLPSGGAGITGPISIGGHGGPGSMQLGPNDPFWARVGGVPFNPPGGTVPPGGLPSGVPPGARFDPFGPPGVPGFEPDRFMRGGPPGGMRNYHPDLEPPF